MQLAYSYDPVTFEFLEIVNCQENPLSLGDYHLPAHSTLTKPPKVIEGYVHVWNSSTWVSTQDNRGKIAFNSVNKETRIVYDLLPLRPKEYIISEEQNEKLLAGWDFDIVGNSVIFVPTISQAKFNKEKEINIARQEVEYSGFVYNGFVFDSDNASLQRLKVASHAAASCGNDFSIKWKLKDNTETELNKNDMGMLMTSLSAYLDNIHKQTQVMKNNLDIAQTLQDVESIEVSFADYNYPTIEEEARNEYARLHNLLFEDTNNYDALLKEATYMSLIGQLNDDLKLRLIRLHNVIELRGLLTYDLLIAKSQGNQEATDEYNDIMRRIEEAKNMTL